MLTSNDSVEPLSYQVVNRVGCERNGLLSTFIRATRSGFEAGDTLDDALLARLTR
ncbi:hypothetical protein [uncultured Tateyamaria sp.]|uniref:hypothetical protein n=1 Tax=uncultured Tateyamaria sp. TaxID=455651 RepID=UPI002619A5DE|nr:hypothetical protein [uncultured Tateyamaria sp.]